VGSRLLPSLIIIIIITDLYSAFRSEDTEALGSPSLSSPVPSPPLRSRPP